MGSQMRAWSGLSERWTLRTRKRDSHGRKGRKDKGKSEEHCGRGAGVALKGGSELLLDRSVGINVHGVWNRLYAGDADACWTEGPA